MLKRIANYLRGYVRIRITGYSPERFLNLCKHKGIEMWGLEAKSQAYEMYMTISGFRKLKPIIKKTRTHIIITERYGVPFFFHKYRKRKVFFLSIFLCVSLIYVLSRFIWNIDIRGNQSITDEVLIEYLETEGVYHGMKRKEVNCEAIDTNIRKSFDKIIWVSASLEGCNIIVQVKENTDTFQVGQIEESPSDILSSADGIITKIITRSGVPCAKEGDVVSVGDILVTGTIEVKNDAGEVVREDYKAADADIYAEVQIPYEDICKTVYQEKKYNNKRHKQIYVKLFGYQFSLGFKRTGTKEYEMESRETRLQINQNFRLPVFYGEYKGKGYKFVNKKRTKEEKERILNDKLDLYCKELEESGVMILEKQIQMMEDEEGLRASGYMKVIQSIGTTRKSVDF